MAPVTCSVADAAKAIGVGRVTLYKHIRSGKIDTVLLGGRRLVKVESLHRLVGVEPFGQNRAVA